MTSGAAGHVPVLVDEVVDVLAREGRHVLLDCTVGLGGHAGAILAAADPEACLIGIDRDETNLLLAREALRPFGERVRLFQANFADAREVLDEAGLETVDGLLADLGVASTQLDDAERGLSFMADGPLDMRMDTGSGRTAADLVNRLDEKKLADLIFELGEERYSRRIAKAIVWARQSEPIRRTKRLADVIASAIPGPARQGRRGVHPATRTFQALRIAVNDEFAALETLLAAMPDLLAPGGRAAVISFHSLEDRRVKQAFAGLAATGVARRITTRPIQAGPLEQQVNPRSRSAKLRCIERV